MPLTRDSRGDLRVPRFAALILAVVFVAVVSLGSWTSASLSAPAIAVSPESINPTTSESDSPSVQRDRWTNETGFLDAQRRLAMRRGRAMAGARGEGPGATLSGTLIKGSAATTTWALYPGACLELSQGIWAPKTFPVADSLQPTPGFPYSAGYTVGQPAGGGGNTIGYTRIDWSLKDALWHVVSSGEPADQRPAIISGQRMLWCGEYNPDWTNPVGYGNNWAQILYLDTGAHAAPYYLMFDGNISCEQAFDRVRIIGGGAGERDPLGNRSECFCFPSPYWNVFGGASCPEPTPCASHQELLLEFTGDFAGGDFPALGQIESRMEGPAVGHYRIGPIAAEHRAVYIFFFSDGAVSTADGAWPQSQGILLDNIDTSDNGAIYTDQAPVGRVDEYGGQVVLGTPSSPIISCRVFPAKGTYWSLVSGVAMPTEDLCSPQKAPSDLFFQSGDPLTGMAVAPQADGISTCSIPVPPGSARIIASWDSYGGRGCVGTYSASAAYFVDGRWVGPWWDGYVGGADTWNHWSDFLYPPAGADSVKLYFDVSCNSDDARPLLLDNVGLQFVSGVPPLGPIVDWADGPRSTFIDGTIRGTYCSQTPCWPNDPQNDDNWNSENAWDRVGIVLASDVGINWRTADEDFAHPRSDYNPAYDVPRLIYRLFDPATLSWSPWDSAEIMRCSVEPCPASSYIDWPPPDKVASGASLPGGFTINGVGSYADLSWLPRGTRMQYYWKAVDVNGGVAYSLYSYWLPQWSTVDDGEYPNLPCHDSPGCVGPKAPEINEWRVLPGVYAPGPPGSLLAGRTNTPILVLDDRYGPVAQALRALGVRADRHPYNPLELGGHYPGGDGGGDHWPNYEEYPIVDSLAAWYRIIIVPMYRAGNFEGALFGHNMTASELSRWFEKDTGPDGGDRCLFVDGDNALSSLLGSNRSSHLYLAEQVLGVASATESWSGATTTPYPGLDDRFSAPLAVAGLAAPGTFVYPVDGGCISSDRSGLDWVNRTSSPKFDALTKVGTTDAQNALFYPNGQVAGVARMRELDATADRDRQKTLANGYSMEYVRDPGIQPTNPGYDGAGLLFRAQVLYKFLTGCRGPRTSTPSDTGKCWPCPTPGTGLAVMGADWSGFAPGFQTATYGPLYPIQAGFLATGVSGPSESAPRVNRIEGNYPNPFNPRTTLRFTSASAGRVEIRVFSVGGRLVRVLHTAVNAGPNEVAWDVRGEGGERLASGVYYYKILFPDAQSLRAPNHLVVVK